MSVFANDVELTCWTCLEEIGYEINLKTGDQVYDSDINSGRCYGPACPDLDGSFWGYTSVPIWWVNWWKSLPNTKNDCTLCCGSGKLAEYDCLYCDGSGERT